MPLYANTLDSLVEFIAKNILNDWKEGTITGTSSTTTFVDTTSRNEADDYFQNTVPISRIRIRTTTDNAAPKDEEREISTDWVKSTGTGTFAPAMSTAPEVGDTYCIMYKWTWDEIVTAINTSCDIVKRDAVFEKIDETVSLVEDVYEYPIPEGFTHIYRLTQGDDNDVFTNKIPPDQYRVVRGGLPKIHFHITDEDNIPTDHFTGMTWAETELGDGHLLRIEGFSKQDKLIEGSDMCYINPVYICYQAAALLHLSRVRRPENEPDDHRVQYQICQAIADANKPKGITRFPPDTKAVIV